MINNAGLNSLDTPDEETPSAGATVKATPKGISPVGDIAMNPKQTAELLANMEEMVNERSGAFNTFMGGLKDASAWGSGGIEGPSRALALREADKAKEFNDVYNMRQQMAALKSSSEQNEAGNKAFSQLLGGGAGGAGGASGMPGQGQIPREIVNAIALEPSLAGKKKIYTDYAQKLAQIQGQFFYNPASYAENISRVDERDRPININAIQSMYGGYPQYQTQGRPSAPVSYGADVIPAIKQGIFGQESSSGKADTSKPNYAGAVGPMQIKQGTFDDLKKDGLIPQDYDINNPEHNKIAGNTLIDKYAKDYKNDPDKIAAAYYGGPGAINKDGSINLDWHDKANPKAPTVGEYIQQVKQKAGLNIAPADMARPGQRITPIEAISAQKVQETQDIAAATASGKYLGGKEAEIIEAGSNAGDRLAKIKNIEGLITNPATNRVFGIFEKPGFWNGFGSIIQSGINAGTLGKVGFEDLDKLVASNMKGATPQEKTAAQIATRDFAEMQLTQAKTLLAGQGAVSDAERGLIAKLTGSRLNSPEAIKEFLTWNKMRANYDENVGELYRQFKEANPRGNFDQFRVTTVARDARRDYNAQMMEFAAQKGIDMKKASAEGAKLNAEKSKDIFNQKEEQASKPKFKYSDSDYAAWKKQNGYK